MAVFPLTSVILSKEGQQSSDNIIAQKAMEHMVQVIYHACSNRTLTKPDTIAYKFQTLIQDKSEEDANSMSAGVPLYGK